SGLHCSWMPIRAWRYTHTRLWLKCACMTSLWLPPTSPSPPTPLPQRERGEHRSSPLAPFGGEGSGVRGMQQLNPAAFLMFDPMQTAFLFGRAGPPACALAFFVADWPGARPAADTRISLVVQGVVRHIVPLDEVPNVLFCPGQEGIDFHQR